MTRICRSVTCCEGFLQGGYVCAVNMRVYPAGFMEINAHDRSRHDAIDETVGYNGNNIDRERDAAHAARLLETRRVVSQTS